MNFVLFYSSIFNLNDRNIVSSIGGVQRYMYELGKVLNKNFPNSQVYFVQLGDDMKELFYEDMHILQYPKINIENLIDKLQYEKYLNNNDILIWGSDTQSIKLKNKNIKTIAIQHGIACDAFPKETTIQKNLYKYKPLAYLYKFLQLMKSYYVFERAEYRVCVDYNYLNWYRTINIYRKNFNNIVTIPNFTFIPKKLVKNKKSKIIISFARRFHYNRGAKMMTQVARKLIRQFDNIEFWFAGDGEEKCFVDKLQKEFPDVVKLTKFSPNETFNYHKKVDIAVIPTIAAEGTSLSLLEAMASNCAVVCTNVGGMTNIVIDQFNGLSVNPDENSLFDAIKKLIEDSELRDRIADNGYISVQQGFDINIWEKKWVNLVNKVIESK